MNSLSIIIPVYNAERTIESLCKTLISLYDRHYRLELVLVNDSSRDSSHLICVRLHEEYPQIVSYLRLARNFGEHNAVMAGLKSATGEFCVVMDDDFQNPPEEVERLLVELQRGYDVVYSNYPAKRDSLFRNLGSHFNDKMANFILRKPADLYLSSFKALNRFLVDEIIKYDGPDPYIDAIILRSTTNIGKAEVRHDPRRQGRSGYTLGKLVSLWGNMVVSYSLIPLRIIGIVGVVMTCIGVYVGGTTLFEHLFFPFDEKPTDLERLTAVTLFFRGFNLLSISVVGEYVGRIYLSLNRDPQFVVRERYSIRQRPQVASKLLRKVPGEPSGHAG